MSTTNTFYLAPGEEFTNCPYNESHRITTAKEVTHVTKCRQNYLKECEEKGVRPDRVACRYVFSHQIPRQEREFHEERCPGAGRFSVASHIAYHGTEEFRDKVKQEQPEKLSDVSSDEAPPPPARSKSPKRRSKPEKTVTVKQEPIDDSPPRSLDRFGRDTKRSAKGSRSKSKSRSRSPLERRRRSRDRERERKRDRDRSRSRDRKSRRDRSREKNRSRSRDRGRKRSYSHGRRSSSPEYERVSNSKRHKHSTKKKAPTPPLLTTADLGDENWDEDCKEGYEPGYDPKVKLEADCILYNPMGLKKSERKKFRLENRKKAKIEIEELPAVDPNSEQPNNSSSSSYKPPMNDVKPVIVNNYKPAPTYPTEEEAYPEEYPEYPEADYGPPHPGYGYGPPHHGYGPPPHMMPGYGPPHPHMGPPPPGFYGPPPGFGPHPMMYGRPMRPPHPHFGPYGPPPGMRPYPFYGRPRMAPPPYEPPLPTRPVHEVERVERVERERRYPSPSPPRDVKPNIKELKIAELVLTEVTAPILVKRDPDEPFEEGEIDEDGGTRNDVKPSQTEDYDWNPDDD